MDYSLLIGKQPLSQVSSTSSFSPSPPSPRSPPSLVTESTLPDPHVRYTEVKVWSSQEREPASGTEMGLGLGLGVGGGVAETEDEVGGKLIVTGRDDCLYHIGIIDFLQRYGKRICIFTEYVYECK